VKKVLVINLGWEQEHLIEALSKRDNCLLYGIHDRKNLKVEKFFEEVRIMDLRDLKGILDFSDEICPDAVISDQCDYSLLAQALVAHKFKLPSPSIDSAQLSNNKYLQRIKAKQKSILIPEFKLCTTIKDVEEFADKNSYPIILKPIDNRGSFGVVKIGSKEEISIAFLSAIVNSHSRMLLVEQFIIGTHYIVDGLNINSEHFSLAVGKKKLSVNDFMNEDIYYFGQDNELTMELKNNNNYNVSQLGYSFGCTSSEYIVDKHNNIFLVESSNRGGGVFISSHVVNNISGIDATNSYISSCLREIDEVKDLQKLDCIHLIYLVSERTGVISYLNLDALNDKGIIKYKLWKSLGDRVCSGIQNSLDRIGVVLFSEKQDFKKIRKTFLKVD